MTQAQPFPPVSSKYGAPTGRASAQLGLDPEFDPPSSIAVSDPQGEYDAGGAYWGTSDKEGPVWGVWRRGKISEGVAYVRARSRAGAMKAAYEENGK